MDKIIHKNLKLEILNKMSDLVTAGFGLVAALAWNEAIKKLFQTIFGVQSNIFAMFGYAIIITIIVVVVTMKIGKAISRLKEEAEAKDNKEKEEVKI